MANHIQAEKRNRQRIKRQAHNRFFKGTMRTLIKKVRASVEAKNGKDAHVQLKEAIPFIDRCAQKGVIPKQKASRLVSRLTNAVNGLVG